MHGVHGKLALPLVKVVPKEGTEQICLLNMVVLIVQGMALNNKLVMTILPAQVFFIIISETTHSFIFFHESSGLHLECMDCMGNLLCDLWGWHPRKK